MNILREVRRVNKRSIPVRIILLLTFCVIFVASTYAWFSTQKNVTLRGLEADVTPWDVSYYIYDEQALDQTVTITLDKLYPGMYPFFEEVNIYNLGTTSTKITYELVSVKVFGEEVLGELDIGISDDGKTTTIFSEDTDYPFSVSYTYDKDYLTGEYKQGAENNDNAHATFTFNASWDYQLTADEAEGEEVGITEDDILARDILDTKFGKGAYEYYTEKDGDTSKAIEIKVKITSTMIHPSQET